MAGCLSPLHYTETLCRIPFRRGGQETSGVRTSGPVQSSGRHYSTVCVSGTLPRPPTVPGGDGLNPKGSTPGL